MKAMLHNAQEVHDRFIDDVFVEEHKQIQERLKKLDNEIEKILLDFEYKIQEVFNKRKDIIIETPNYKPICKLYTGGFEDVEEVVRKKIILPETIFSVQIKLKGDDTNE